MLIVADLTDDLTAVFLSQPPTKAAAALAIAQAYYDYTLTAQFAASVPVLPAVYRDTMANTLEVALSVPGLPGTVAAAFASALNVYWGAVAVTGAQTGTTSGCPGASSLTGTLTPIFANLANTAATCAAGVANALHTATLTVSANLAPPPSPVIIS